MFVLFSFLGKCQSRRHNFGCEKSSTTKCSICYMDGETQLRDKHQKLIQYKYTQKSCTRFLYIFIFFSHSKYLSNIPVKFQISTSFRFFFKEIKIKKEYFYLSRNHFIRLHEKRTTILLIMIIFCPFLRKKLILYVNNKRSSVPGSRGPLIQMMVKHWLV